MEEIREFARIKYRPGVLTPKCEQLIAWVAAVLSDSRAEMRTRLVAAQEAGASDAEILQALYLAMRARADHRREEAYAAMENTLGEVLTPSPGTVDER